MAKRLNLVLFLGAGFSAPFGHPVMNKFFTFADSPERLTDEERDLLWKLIRESRRANSFLESSPSNLEDILSFSEMNRRLGLFTQAEDRSLMLKNIIRKIYSTTHFNPRQYWNNFNHFGYFLSLNRDGSPSSRMDLSNFDGNISIITTNYDLNIESACFYFNNRVNPGFDFKNITNDGLNIRIINNIYDKNGILVCKLHGSVNWYENVNKEIVVDGRIVELNPSIEDGERFSSLPLPCTNGYKISNECNPVIIPPSYLKPELINPLEKIWSSAANALSKANVIVFVGYSFPPSDTEMRYFLASALSDNPSLKAIYIVDPLFDEIYERLKKPDSKTGSHFRDLIVLPKTPIKSWTDINLQLDDYQ